MLKTSKVLNMQVLYKSEQCYSCWKNSIVKEGVCGFYANVYRQSTAYMPLTPPGGKAPLSLPQPSCGFSGTTRVIEGNMHSQSPIPKDYGTLSKAIILTYLREQSCILHTLTKPTIILYFWSKECLECLKCRGLWKSFGIGRFRCSYELIQANKCANSDNVTLYTVFILKLLKM